MKEINNSDAEAMLLSGKSIDELIQLKIQEDYKAIRDFKPLKPEKVEDISKLSKNVLFSKASVFKVFNKISRTESYVNGIQAEALLGLQNSVKEALLAGKIRAFIAGDLYVEFLYAKTNI